MGTMCCCPPCCFITVAKQLLLVYTAGPLARVATHVQHMAEDLQDQKRQCKEWNRKGDVRNGL